jgi:hypothetical protein
VPFFSKWLLGPSSLIICPYFCFAIKLMKVLPKKRMKEREVKVAKIALNVK